jgi:hypothetical protein
MGKITDKIKEIHESMYIESPESLIELVKYLNSLGYRVFTTKPRDVWEAKEIPFSEEYLLKGLNVRRKFWTAILKRISRCNFCNHIIDGFIEDHSVCPNCGKILYLNFPKGSHMEFAIEGDKRFMYSLTLSVQERRKNEKAIDYYLDFKDCPRISQANDSSMYYKNLKESYRKLEDEIKLFPKIFKVRKKGKIRVVSVEEKDMSLFGSLGHEYNYTTFYVFDGKEFRKDHDELPAPWFVQIFEKWKYGN